MILVAILTADRKLGCSDTGLRVDKRLKLDKPLGLNLTFTEPRPIKVTRTVAETISGEQKAIENAKTGKVTAVVAVMCLKGKTKVNLHSANSWKKARY